MNPRLTFTNSETIQLAQLRLKVEEFRAVSGEVKIGTESNDRLLADESAARTKVEAFLPSELIEFSNDVTEAFTLLRRAELIRAYVASATAKLKFRQTSLGNDLKCAFGNWKTDITYRIIRAHLAQPAVSKEELVDTAHGKVSRACLKQLETLSAIDGDAADRMDALLRIIGELGARVEVSA